MTLPNERDDLQALAGEYVLGTLPIAEREAFETRLATNAELKKAVADWEERFFPYTAIVEPVTPSDYLWPRIERSLKERASSSVPPATKAPKQRSQPRSQQPSQQRSWLHSLSFWRGAAGMGLAAALVLAIMLTSISTEAPTPEYMVVLLAPQTQSAGWVVQASNRQEIQLIPLGTFEVPEGKSLEFWTKAEDWQAPVSLGLVEPGQPVRMHLDELPPLEDNQLFELTLEDESGSSTGLPTGPIEFIGRAIEI